MGSIPITRFHSGWTGGLNGNVNESAGEHGRDRGERAAANRAGVGSDDEDMTNNMLPWLSW